MLSALLIPKMKMPQQEAVRAQLSHDLFIRAFQIFSVVLLLCPVFARGIAAGTQSTTTAFEERDRGIQLYQQGDAKGAVEFLRKAVEHHKDDISAWHNLGLALEKLGKRDDARKAHQKAGKIAEGLLTSSLDRPGGLPRAQLLEAADSSDRYLALSVSPSRKKTREWSDRAELLRVLGTDRPPVGELYTGKNVTTKARVLSKPEPSYTEQARKDQVTGTVILRCVFAADGQVRAIHVVAGLPDGLTLRAIVTSRHIKFGSRVANSV
jgi:tetratricopeptide (TPR) repeat protein